MKKSQKTVKKFLLKHFILKYYPLLLCFIFFLLYSTLTIIRHNNFQSYGFDLGINDQIVWEYSRFKSPITSIDHIPFIPKLYVHFELIYALLAPFYWIWTDARMLLILEAAFVCFSGIAIFLLAKYYKLQSWLPFAILFVYLLFYGVQNALWFDVHSATFGTAFMSFFIYFLVSRKLKWAIILFVLTITSKENFAGMTFLIATLFYITTKSKSGIFFAGASLLYLGFIFGIYFPYFTEGYRFQNPGGLFSQLDPMMMVSTAEKRDVYFYTFLSYGFLPLLNPLYLLPIIGNLASYFILGSSVSTAQGLFLQYRVELVPLISWATIVTITKYKWLNNKYIAIYLVLCALLVQYLLHLPLSYFTKSWFWTQPSGVPSINKLIMHIPESAPLVAQNNIIPHVNYRDTIVTLWPIKREFSDNTPCGEKICDWFRWADSPQYLIVDTSPEWDIRHLLGQREEFIKGLTNLEKTGVIKKSKQIGSTILYKVEMNPAQYKENY